MTRKGKREQSELILAVAADLEKSAELVEKDPHNGFTPYDPADNALTRVLSLINEETETDYEVEAIEGYEDAVCGYHANGENFRLHYCLGAMQLCCMRRGLSEAETYEELRENVLASLPQEGALIITHSVSPTITLRPELIELTQKIKKAQAEIGLE